MRVLNADELRRVLPVLRAGQPAHGLAMLFMLLTLARCEEVAGARSDEYGEPEQVWGIPPEKR